jgi:hypothetical protein
MRVYGRAVCSASTGREISGTYDQDGARPGPGSLLDEIASAASLSPKPGDAAQPVTTQIQRRGRFFRHCASLGQRGPHERGA